MPNIDKLNIIQHFTASIVHVHVSCYRRLKPCSVVARLLHKAVDTFDIFDEISVQKRK